MKIKYNKIEKTWDIITISMFGEIGVHAQFKTKKEAEYFIYLQYGYGYESLKK
jgi:hypothetical protein